MKKTTPYTTKTGLQIGSLYSPDSGSPHIAHAIANLLFFLHFDLQDFGDGWPAPMPEPHPTA